MGRCIPPLPIPPVTTAAARPRQFRSSNYARRGIASCRRAFLLSHARRLSRRGRRSGRASARSRRSALHLSDVPRRRESHARRLPEVRHRAGARGARRRRATTLKCSTCDSGWAGRSRSPSARGAPHVSDDGLAAQSVRAPEQRVAATGARHAGRALVWLAVAAAGWRSLRSRNFNMFTLIGLRVAVTYAFTRWPCFFRNWCRISSAIAARQACTSSRRR